VEARVAATRSSAEAARGDRSLSARKHRVMSVMSDDDMSTRARERRTLTRDAPPERGRNRARKRIVDNMVATLTARRLAPLDLSTEED
jgi:hypothetical protein